jgi:hypothetical protein
MIQEEGAQVSQLRFEFLTFAVNVLPENIARVNTNVA